MTLDRSTSAQPLPQQRTAPAAAAPARTGSAARTAAPFEISLAVQSALAARAVGHPVGTDRSSAPDPAGEPLVAQLLALAPARRIRLELLVVADRLMNEFAGRLSAGGVLRCVAGCRTDLRGSGLAAGLPEAVDRLARQRLTEQTAPPTRPAAPIGSGPIAAALDRPRLLIDLEEAHVDHTARRP